MLRQNLAQKQQMKILPQQIQLLNLFHLNTLELEQRIQQEIEENPLLEETTADSELEVEKFNKDEVRDFSDWEEHAYDDIPNYKLEYENYFNNERMPDRPIAEVTDFRETLKQQYMFLSKDQEELVIANYLIDSLNESGLLEYTLDEIAEDFSFKHKRWVEPEEIEKVLKKIKEMDPPGIGAGSIRECLLLQLKRMNTKQPDVKAAIELLENHYNDLRSRNMDKIKVKMKLEDDEIKIILKLIASLKMKPISENTSTLQPNQQILPDFILTTEGDMIEVSLFKQRSSTLFINQSWMESVLMTENNKKADKHTRQYLRNKLNAAQWFVSAIKQRESTMLKVVKAIVKLQYDYFREGDIRKIKPMILKNIADMVGVDISTVSRITCNKYVNTPFGNILLKDLF